MSAGTRATPLVLLGASVLAAGRLLWLAADSAWKKGRTVMLPRVSAGEHTPVVAVVNSNDPAPLQASCPPLGAWMACWGACAYVAYWV